MDEGMRFPDTVEEFMDQYKVVDREGIYMSKGSKLVPIFRMDQWFEHEKTQLSQEGITKDATPSTCSTASSTAGIISRQFEEIVVSYPPVDLCNYPEYKGKPYFSIKYTENGQEFIGYGTYNPEVLSKYLKEYFMPPAQPEERTKKRTETRACDLISRQAAIDAADAIGHIATMPDGDKCIRRSAVKYTLSMLPPAQPERRYTEEELKVFQHGISLSLLSKRSSQHWCYDEDTATEIEFLEQLHEKVSADMRGETE